MINAHCECGDIALSAEGPIQDFSHCHCSQCRRLHGAAFATFAALTRAQLRYERGEDQLGVYASSNHSDRYFCRRCGSTIGVFAKNEPELFYLSMSVVEGDPPRPEGYHAWVASKAPWHEINDSLEQYATGDTDD